MTTLYAVGRFPRSSDWGVFAEPIQLDELTFSTHDESTRNRAIARLAVFLSHAWKRWSFIDSAAELQALIEVLGDVQTERLVCPDVLSRAGEDLAELSRLWKAYDEPLVEWLNERTRGSLSITRHPMPNPWVRAVTNALWDALVARGVDVIDSRTTPRMLPLTCVLIAILGAPNALTHHANSHAQETDRMKP